MEPSLRLALRTVVRVSVPNLWRRGALGLALLAVLGSW